jgi:hypothetical protein
MRAPGYHHRPFGRVPGINDQGFVRHTVFDFWSDVNGVNKLVDRFVSGGFLLRIISSCHLVEVLQGPIATNCDLGHVGHTVVRVKECLNTMAQRGKEKEEGGKLDRSQIQKQCTQEARGLNERGGEQLRLL